MNLSCSFLDNSLNGLFSAIPWSGPAVILDVPDWPTRKRLILKSVQGSNWQRSQIVCRNLFCICQLLHNAVVSMISTTMFLFLHGTDTLWEKQLKCLSDPKSKYAVNILREIVSTLRVVLSHVMRGRGCFSLFLEVWSPPFTLKKKFWVSRKISSKGFCNPSVSRLLRT